MKTIIKLSTILICLLITNTLMAQEYRKNPFIDQFVGTWEGSSGGETFRIVISKHKLDMTDDEPDEPKEYADKIVGWHSYTKNNQVVESSTDKSKPIFLTWENAHDNSTLIGGIKVSDTKVWFNFHDLTKNKRCKATIEMVAGKTDELRWTLEDKERANVIVDGVPSSPPVPEGFTVPTNLILKKKSTPVPRPPDRIF